MKKYLIIFGWGVMLLVMAGRSIIYINRVLAETKKDYYPEIDGCRINFEWEKDDQRIIYLYRNLQKTCEK